MMINANILFTDAESVQRHPRQYLMIKLVSLD